MKYIKKVFRAIVYTILVFLVSLCLYTFLMTDILKKDYVSVFGYTYFVVSTGSMSGTIEVNDIVFVKITDDVSVDDVVTYKNDEGMIITHRLVQVVGDKLICQGDVNNTQDDPISKDNIIGKVSFVISPAFILKSIAIFLILFIFLALINFDKIFKTYIMKIEAKTNASHDEDVKPKKEVKKKEKVIKKKVEKKEKVKEEAPVDEKRDITLEEIKAKKKKKEIEKRKELEEIEVLDDFESPVVSTKTEKIIEKKEEVTTPDFVPEALFKKDHEELDKAISSGFTVTIPISDIERIQKIQEMELDDKSVNKFFQEEGVIDLGRNSMIARENHVSKEKEKELLEQISNLLKMKNKTITTTRLNKNWLIKFKYIYKLAHILLINNKEGLNYEIEHPPFKEIYDYDLEKAGLYDNLRNKIYMMPIYVFLRILTFAVIYNDEEFFDGIFKIMKYKIQIDRNFTFREVRSNDNYSKNQLKSLVKFMESVSNKYDNKNVFELDKIEKLVKIENNTK